MSRTTLGKKTQLYKERIVSPNVAGDQPIAGSENSREIGILVHNPAGTAMTVTAYSVHVVSGRIKNIPTGAIGQIVITTEVPHGLRENETVVLSNTTTAPVVDGSYTATNVTDRTFEITSTVAITTAGEGVFVGPEREFPKESEDITGSAELIADHIGGAFRIKLTGFAGPLDDANAVDVYWRSI